MQEDFKKLASGRETQYIKLPEDENLLDIINGRIEDKEKELIEFHSAAGSDFKNLFVVGAPRSG